MQHFVKQNIFKRYPRDPLRIENPANDNGVMRRVKMAQHGAGRPAAPAEQRAAHQAIEKARIEIFEDLFQVAMASYGPGNKLTPPNLPDDVHPLAHVPAVEIQPVAMAVGASHGTTKE